MGMKSGTPVRMCDEEDVEGGVEVEVEQRTG